MKNKFFTIIYVMKNFSFLRQIVKFIKRENMYALTKNIIYSFIASGIAVSQSIQLSNQLNRFKIEFF